jgi:hypothetical protein
MKEEQDMQCAPGITALANIRIHIPVERVRHAMMLQVLEKAYVGLSEPQGLSYAELLRDMEREARKLLRLDVEGTVFAAAAVRFHIQDSNAVHGRELPEMFNLVPLQSRGFALRMDPALGGEPVELRLAPCSDLGAAVLLEPDENGAYHPCPLTPDDLHVLYATVRGEDDELYKKYIWLVGFSDL